MEGQARRVLILGEADLLVRGVASLLEFDHSLHIVGITADPQQAQEWIDRFRPDVLLVDESHFPLPLGMGGSRSDLKGCVTLVTLHEDHNRIRIFHVEERMLTHPGQFIEALKS